MELKKIHEDKRGAIHLVQDLLEDGKEFTFLEMKKGSARGGCLHSNKEHMVVIKGKIRCILDDKEIIMSVGDSHTIPAEVAHAFIALEDSIVSEWGITSEEKRMDRRKPDMRAVIEKANESLK